MSTWLGPAARPCTSVPSCRAPCSTTPAPGMMQRWKDRGHLAVEMEAAVLYTLGAIHKIETLCLVTISDLIAADAGTSRADQRRRAEARRRPDDDRRLRRRHRRPQLTLRYRLRRPRRSAQRTDPDGRHADHPSRTAAASPQGCAWPTPRWPSARDRRDPIVGLLTDARQSPRRRVLVEHGSVVSGRDFGHRFVVPRPSTLGSNFGSTACRFRAHGL